MHDLQKRGWGSGLKLFFVEKIHADSGFFSITGSEVKHITKVLRMEAGDRLILLDAGGVRFLATILSAHPREVRVRLDKVLPKPAPSPVEIVLCQALLKSGAMDYVIQKTSELGVDCILPFSSERTVVKLAEDLAGNRVTRWRQIARSSTKQSGRLKPPEIENVQSFEQLMESWRGKNVLKVIFWEEEGSNHLKSLLRREGVSRTVVGVVGPEGGFGRKEIEAALHAGFLPVSLGKRILRAETAGIAMVTIVQYELGDMGS